MFRRVMAGKLSRVDAASVARPISWKKPPPVAEAGKNTALVIDDATARLFTRCAKPGANLRAT